MRFDRLRYRFVAACVPMILRLRRCLLWCADACVPCALPLYTLTTGVAQTQILATFVALGLPDRLAQGPVASDALCPQHITHHDVFKRFLRASQALGLVKRRRDGRYASTRLSRALRTSLPTSMAPFAAYMASESNVNAWQALTPVVQSGINAFMQRHQHSVWDYFAAHPLEERQFAAAMTGLACMDAPAVAHAYPFDRHPTLCDVGGGRGALLQAILAVYPALSGVVMDQPTVAAAPLEPDASPHTSRLTFMSGNFLRGVPTGFDAYVLRHILHDWDDATCRVILAHCRQALHGCGRLLVVESQVAATDAAFVGAIKDLTMAVVCGGRERSRAEMQVLLHTSGLKLVRVWPTAATVVVYEAMSSA